MKRPGSKAGSGKAAVDDEATVWSHTAQSIEPLKKKKPRVRVADTSDGIVDQPPRLAKSPVSEPTKSKAPSLPRSQPAPIKREPPPPPIATFDRKKAKRIRAGRVDIEARIDLHGMTQSEAHAVLASFLRRSQSKGCRVVLIITGKGKPSDDDRQRPFDMMAPRERGVLKRNVPRWLDEPELRALIVSYATAAQHHGGDGALYVHLRKRDGS